MYCVKSLITHVGHRNIKNLMIKPRVIKRNFFKITRSYSSKLAEDEDDTENIVNDICKGDPEKEKKLRVLMLEVEVMRQDGRTAPERMNTSNWENLLELQSRNQRTSYLSYLWKNEMSKINQKARKEARRRELDEMDEEEVKEYPDDLLYGIKHLSLFLRIRDQSINNFDNYRALQALTYGQSVIIDCSYEEHMVNREILNAAKQLTYVFGDNRLHKEPFNLHLCNVNKEGKFMEQFKKNVPSLEEPWFPLNIHTKSYLDLFPKDKLVYLTPHCREELTYFDHDAVYIIGCMVDKMNNEPHSLAKAKRDGIKMAKLPLDRYLEWAPGSKKNLNINHMIPILLDLKSTGDWDYSLRHIPRRKLMETKIKAMQNKFENSGKMKDIKRYMNLRVSDRSVFLDKRNTSRKSLYDDENI
ncbi:mitochondrial ribonuclease P protein 1 homolog [Pieris napi]|uniref:mitochondrial ribonuclease P protein 1 homolog n=1 Tax=Pieris napi TaxID=78633 RepID=UPI001FBA89C0|nr:mitochondrial ribonuclease P protein 1 homolog [Pieris napi]